MRSDVADIALGVADHARDALQHAEAVVAENGQLHGIGCRCALVARPFDINLAFRFVQKIRHIGTINRVYGYALASRDVANDAFAADRITTAGAVHQHVSLAADCDGIVISKDAANDAGNATGLRRQTFGLDISSDGVSRASGKKPGEDLARGIFPVAYAGHQVFGFTKTVG